MFLLLFVDFANSDPSISSTVVCFRYRDSFNRTCAPTICGGGGGGGSLCMDIRNSFPSHVHRHFERKSTLMLARISRECNRQRYFISCSLIFIPIFIWYLWEFSIYTFLKNGFQTAASVIHSLFICASLVYSLFTYGVFSLISLRSSLGACYCVH